MFVLGEIWQGSPISVSSVTPYGRVSRIRMSWEDAKGIKGNSISSAALAEQDLLSIAPSVLEHQELLRYP